MQTVCLAQQRLLVARFVQQEYEYKYERQARQQYIDFVDTYSAAYRRDVFVENGGFDEAFTTRHNPKPSNEDQELSFRLARKGYRLIFAPGAVVEHLHDVNLAEYVTRKYGIGYWKAFMLRWLPEKTFKDSHTPPSQRWQILLLGLTILFCGAALFWHTAWLIALASLALFFASTLPMLVQIWRRDKSVLFVAQALLICRAAALGAGLAIGFVLAPHQRHEGLSLWTRPVKRLIDVTGAIVGGLLSAPIILAAAIAIRLDTIGPAFFTQERAGENGKPFRMIKLRTMVDGAEKQISQLIDLNPIDGPAFKLPHDPRVTCVGRFLRRWSIDELPQFWNVLRGEMSLVGPRPEQPVFVDQYNEQQRRRLIVKPGLTGPAQVAGRGDLNFDQRLQLELNYIECYSLRLDLQIMWRSIGAIITGKGAY
jgi:lipopolysaccharide/colanic/teichoic acid biosynthesis glycosyltransferase